jgi:energy-coupling factor transporter ATP-binding protein EcfA2
MQNLSATNPLRNLLIDYAKVNDPQIYRDALSYLNKLQAEQAGRLALPAKAGPSQTTIPLFPQNKQIDYTGTGTIIGRQSPIKTEYSKITNMNDFKRSEEISGSYKDVETNAYQKILEQENSILEDYKNNPEYGKKINPDNFKRYFKDIGYDGHNAAAIQEPSSYLANRAFSEALNNNPEKYATFYAGSSGSGKTTAIESLSELSGTLKNSSVILDSNLSSDSAIGKINQALDAGKKPYVMFAYRKPLDALSGVIWRMFHNAEEMGRIVPTKVIAKNMIGSWENVSEILPKEFPGMKIYYIDNTGLAGSQNLISFDKMKSIVNYPTENKLVGILNNKIKELYDNPEKCKKLFGKSLSREQYLGFIK